MFERRLDQVLNAEYSDLRDFSDIQAPFLRIYNENTLEAVLIKSNQSIVLEALLKSSNQLPEQAIEMVRGGQAVMRYDNHNKVLPDWAGIKGNRSPSDLQRPFNLLPGETKTSWSWGTAEIREKCKLDKNGYVHSTVPWPLRQLLHYCVHSFARYGYIVTDKELFVARIGCTEPLPFAESQDSECKANIADNAVIEYTSVPWDHTEGSDGLSINLALWILHIMAANGGDLKGEPYCNLGDETLVDHINQQRFTRSEPSFDKNVPLSFESTYQQTKGDTTDVDEDSMTSGAQSESGGPSPLRDSKGKGRAIEKSSSTAANSKNKGRKRSGRRGPGHGSSPSRGIEKRKPRHGNQWKGESFASRLAK